MAKGDQILLKCLNVNIFVNDNSGVDCIHPGLSCYTSQQTYIKVKDTYSEGGTHEETQHPQSKAKVRTRDERTKSQPDKLQIHKTDAVIV